MDIIRDLLYTNRRVAKKAFKSMLENWLIIFTGLFYSTATIILYLSLKSFWIFAGLVSIIVTSALTSNYLYLLKIIITRGAFNFQDFKDGFGMYLQKIWSILFIGYVANLILSLIAPIITTFIGGNAFNLIVLFLTFILFNSIPEATYQKHYGPLDTVTSTIEFSKENWVEWFVPNIILLIGFYIITGQQSSIINMMGNVFNYFLSFGSVDISPIGIILYLAGQICFSYIMIYRGYLYDVLSTSNRRKRLFMREF